MWHAKGLRCRDQSASKPRAVRVGALRRIALSLAFPLLLVATTANAESNHVRTRLGDVDIANNYVRVALAEAMAGKPVSEAVTRPYGCREWPDTLR